jgi:hypothetical protein
VQPAQQARRLSPARKVAFFFGLGAVLAILAGAGFANMSASDAPTALETAVVRWVALACLVVALSAYLVDRRRMNGSRSAHTSEGPQD